MAYTCPNCNAYVWQINSDGCPCCGYGKSTTDTKTTDTDINSDEIRRPPGMSDEDWHAIQNVVGLSAAAPGFDVNKAIREIRMPAFGVEELEATFVKKDKQIAELEAQIDRLHKFDEIERGFTEGIEEDYKREIRQLQADNKTMHDLLLLCQKWFKEHKHPKGKCVYQAIKCTLKGMEDE